MCGNYIERCLPIASWSMRFRFLNVPENRGFYFHFFAVKNLHEFPADRSRREPLSMRGKTNGLNRIDGSGDGQYWKISIISAVVGIKKFLVLETGVKRICSTDPQQSPRFEITRAELKRIFSRANNFRLEIGERNSAPTSVTIELRRTASWRNYIL